MSRDSNLDHFAPIAAGPFGQLAEILRKNTDFLLFEGYRDPQSQDLAYRTGHSKAVAFESAHQYGLAADFVPFRNGGWVWPPASSGDWATLRRYAHACGLSCPIDWDLPHVEHPHWTAVRDLIFVPRSAGGGGLE